MCTGVEIALALASTAAGTGATMYAQDQALKKQDRIAAEGIRRQELLSREADDRVRRQIGDTARANSNKDAASVEGQLLEAVRRNRASQAQPEALGAGGSDRFAEDTANTISNGKADIAQLITNLSKIDAPQLQRQREGVQVGRTATDLGLIGLRSQGQDFLTRLRSGAVRPNPWLTGFGSLAQGVGTGLAGKAGSGDLSEVSNAGANLYRRIPRWTPPQPFGG